MNTYDNDPRVWNRNGCGNVYFVNHGNGQSPKATVREFLGTTRWVVWLDDEDAQTDLVEYATADDAIRSLIGDPQ